MSYYEGYLYTQYNCNNPMKMCSKFELTMKQWANSSITLNPPVELVEIFPAKISLRYWNSS